MLATSEARNIEKHELEDRRQVDPNPYWSSSLFHEVFLRNDAPKKYAKIWEQDVGFENFQQEFHNFVLECEDEDFNTWSESDTIKNWIVHIMEMLGWHDRCNTSRQSPFIEELSLTVPENGKKKTYRADLVYVDEPKHKQFIAKEKHPENRLREVRSKATGAKIVLEAKYWDRLEQNRQNKTPDKKRLDIDQDDGTRHLDANDQILKYMEIVDLDFGILSDGKTWRLFHKELSKGDVKRYFEFDLGNLAELVKGGIDNEKSRRKFLDEARYFYFLFRKPSLVQVGTEAPLVYQILEYSKKYAHSIEEDLKERFISAMGITCNALSQSFGEAGEEVNLDIIRNIAESHLFNILFMRSCETRKILPLNCPDYHRISLTEVIETLDAMELDPEKGMDVYLRFLKLAFGRDFNLEGTQIYDRLMKLYKVVHDGEMGFGIAGFKESVFSKEEWKLAKRHKINNAEMLQILFSINFTDSEFGSRKYQQIPYNFFTPRQLGSIYESFLEFKLSKASEFMVFTKKQWKGAKKGSDAVKKLLKKGTPFVEKGSLYFTPDNRERKVTGSYYTPDYIVQYIVRQTLGPLCDGKSPQEILDLTVCDPAMGSGHFLSGALNYLNDRYREAVVEHEIRDVGENSEESARRILDSCIYGVDVNARAVKLAKMGLWLATALMNRKLEKLDDQLKCGDSLDSKDFKWKSEFHRVFKNNGGFSAVVGNPPYIRIQILQESNPESVARYKKEYESAEEGNYDIYVLFIEKGRQLLGSNGRLGYIVPHKFMNASYGKGIRSHLAGAKACESIIHFGHQQVFHGASTYTCLLFLTLAENQEVGFEIVDDLEAWRNSTSNRMGFMNHSDLTQSSWIFTDRRESSLLSKLKGKSSPLSDHCKRIFQGIKTSGDKVYIVEEKGRRGDFINIYSRHTDSNHLVEKELFHPMIKGKNARSYSLSESGLRILFPYASKGGGKSKPICPKDMKRKYPKTWSYLQKCQEFLENREDGKLIRAGRIWYEYIYPKALDVMPLVKLFTPDIAPEPRFCFDDIGEIFFTGGVSGGYGLIPNDGKDTYFLLGMLNSAVTNWYIKKTSTSMRGGFYSYESRFISSLPIPNGRGASGQE